MYTVYNPNAVWPQHQMAPMPGQVYFTQVPAGAAVGNGNVPSLMQPMTYYPSGVPPTNDMAMRAIPVGKVQGQGQVQGQPSMYCHPAQLPGWFPMYQPTSHVTHWSSTSTSDDDVFTQDSTYPQSVETSNLVESNSIVPLALSAPQVPVHTGVVIERRKKRRPKSQTLIKNMKTSAQTKVVECQTDETCFRRRKRSNNKTRRKLMGNIAQLHPTLQTITNNAHIAYPLSHNNRMVDNSFSLSGSSSRQGSPHETELEDEVESLVDAIRPPFSRPENTIATETRHQNDLTLYDVFSASLCSAINKDPPDPSLKSSTVSNNGNSSAGAPKTSSPIQEGESNKVTTSGINQCLINAATLKKGRSRFLTSVTSDRCLRFSQNGWDVESEEETEEVISNCLEMKDPIAIRREDFLKTLEQEREKQKKCVLPKYAPKMNCKFCKNNGEPPEIYTKHRLHFNEKTVCPLLRHYVCRLCNSTGDFAHTIRHCPFNTRYDKIAWKATFLLEK